MHSIDKTETERVQIEMKNYKGKDYMDIRVYFKAETGDWLPTKKGVTIAANKLNEFIESFKAEQGIPKIVGA